LIGTEQVENLVAAHALEFAAQQPCMAELTLAGRAEKPGRHHELGSVNRPTKTNY
jgi:hypothetical protein